jgi:hypothetical protein
VRHLPATFGLNEPYPFHYGNRHDPCQAMVGEGAPTSAIFGDHERLCHGVATTQHSPDVGPFKRIGSLVIVWERTVTLLFASLRSAAHVADSLL